MPIFIAIGTLWPKESKWQQLTLTNIKFYFRYLRESQLIIINIKVKDLFGYNAQYLKLINHQKWSMSFLKLEAID